MRRFMYKLRKYEKIIQILGIILAIIGLVLVLKIIPIKLWLFLLGCVFIVLGWFFFRMY